MKGAGYLRKTVKGLLKQGYTVDAEIIRDIRKTIAYSYPGEKEHPYFILGLVCDYGFYIGMNAD